MKKLFISSVLSLGMVLLGGCATAKPHHQCAPDGKTVKCPHQQDGCCHAQKKNCPLGS